MHPLLIIRTNLYSPDIVIYPNDHVKEKIEQILSQVQYPSSIYYIILEYIRTRLKDCTKKALRSEYNPDHCPIIFDSWTCWKSLLIPLLGIHFLLLPIRPGPGSVSEYVYEVVSSLATSTQGISVSCLLCFSNRQVKERLKKKWNNVLKKLNLSQYDMVDEVGWFKKCSL